MSLSATLTLDDAGRRLWDVIAVGAGPAGALAARESARRGLAVLLVDQAEFPRWKVCGSCINLRSQRVLETCGLADLLDSRGAVAVTGLRLSALGHSATVPLPGEKILSRAAFDSALVEAAILAGVHFLPRTQAHLGAVEEDVRFVHLRQDATACLTGAKIVLAAGGLGGTFLAGRANERPRVDAAARIGAGTIVAGFPSCYETPNIFMACGTQGYVGLVRLEDGRLNVAAALDPAVVRRHGLPRTASMILAEAGFAPLADLESANWRGTPLLTRHVWPPARTRLFLLGDAAGYVEPFTGEGIAWALAAALAIGPFVQAGCGRWDERLVERWAASYRQIVARRQWVCRAVAQVLRHPRLMSTLARVLGRVPRLATPLVRYLNAS